MTWVINLSCVIAILLICYFTLPAEVWETIRSNCVGADGSIKFRYLRKEIRSLVDFFGELLLFAIVLAGMLAIGLLWLNHHVPLKIVADSMAQADTNPQVWRQNLTSSPRNVKAEFTAYHINQGGTRESAISLMRFLWRSLPFLIVVCFATVTILLHVFSRAMQSSVAKLSKLENQRQIRRIRRRYLRSSPTSDRVVT